MVENDDGCLMGKCYEDDDDSLFIANVYCKADSYTHWHFYGEDYYNLAGVPIDPYYRLCGSHFFTLHITAMCFIWKLAENILSENMPDRSVEIHDNYFDHDRVRKLVDLMLDGYEIVKE